VKQGIHFFKGYEDNNKFNYLTVNIMAKILTDLEIRKELAHAFQVSMRTIIDALNDTTQSDLARRAMDLGGAEKGTEQVKAL
jgi:hypothetical protein